MTKQEFMAFSLPYGLKVTVTGKSNVSGEHIYTLYSAYSDTPVIEVVGESDFKTDKYKSICHPLSDLTKEIEHNGEMFIPINYNAFKHDKESLLELMGGFANYKSIKFGIIQKLIEWHFAVGLNNDDYIDVNTLNINPYK